MSGPQNRPKTGQFQPGQSGNPGGRPRNPFKDLIAKETRDGAEIVEKVLIVLRTSEKQSEVLEAAAWLRDTGWNKPVQGIQSVDGDGNDVQPAIFFTPAGKKR